MQNSRKRQVRVAAALLLCAAILRVPAAGGVETLTVLALFEDQVFLHVNGNNRMIAVGETSPEGIKLVEASSERAVVIIDGKEEVLQLGMVTNFPGGSDDVAPSWEGPEKLTLWQEDDGFFYAEGHINNSSVTFLVDTGANTIAINRLLAERLGIDYENGQKGAATTAGGVTPMYMVTLDHVSIGEITLRNVEAGVLLGEHPDIPLLGMSFLGKLDMTREGKRLELKRR